MNYPMVTLNTADVAPKYRGPGAGFQNHIMYPRIGKSSHIEGFTFCGLSVPIKRRKGWYFSKDDECLGPITRHAKETCKTCIQRNRTGIPVSPDTGYMNLVVSLAQEREQAA